MSTAHRATRRRAPRAVVLGTFLALTSMVAASCGNDAATAKGDGSDRRPGTLAGVVAQPAPDVSAVTLPTAEATPVAYSFVPPAGELQLVYFGYTACPDICPTTLADLRNALRKARAGVADKVRIAMATVDPRRDTAEVISGYVHSFFTDSVALRTDDDAMLRAAATAFGASYEAKYPNQGEPEVSHSAYLYAVDHTGHVVVEWPFGTTAADIAHDLELLLDRPQEGSP